MAEGEGFEPTVRLPVQRFSSLKIMVTPYPFLDLSVWPSLRFYALMILTRDASYCPVPRSSHAIPFANSCRRGSPFKSS